MIMTVPAVLYASRAAKEQTYGIWGGFFIAAAAAATSHHRTNL